MAAKRYRDLSRTMTYIVLADAVLFVLYLICAGNGITALKVLLAIVCILGSALAVGFLYMAGELTRQRSRWMVVSFLAIIVCVILSLILRFPSPNPYKDANYQTPIFDQTTALPASALWRV